MKYFAFLVLTILAAVSAHPMQDFDWSTVISKFQSKEPLITTPLNGSHREGKGRITFGTEVKSLATYGFQVGLLTASRVKAGNFWCGGSIISADYCVTAAHCLHDATTGFAYVGFLDRTRQTGDCKRIPISFADYIVHEAYNPTTTANDIALLKFPEKISFSASVYPIALNSNPNINPGTDCIISGWGMNENGQQPNILATANVKIITEQECKQYFAVGPSQICQGVARQVGVCQGDSGGPITMNANGKPVLIGLTSFGPASGCVNDIPRVYTRISFFFGWICKHTGVCK